MFSFGKNTPCPSTQNADDGFSSYINFAHGDEDLEVVYGSHVKRLQALKKTFDPQNVFDQWFPLTPG